MPRNDKVARRMLTTEEAAAHLGTTVRHIRRLVSDHQLSHYKVGGRTRYPGLRDEAGSVTTRAGADTGLSIHL